MVARMSFAAAVVLVLCLQSFASVDAANKPPPPKKSPPPPKKSPPPKSPPPHKPPPPLPCKTKTVYATDPKKLHLHELPFGIFNNGTSLISIAGEFFTTPAAGNIISFSFTKVLFPTGLLFTGNIILINGSGFFTDIVYNSSVTHTKKSTVAQAVTFSFPAIPLPAGQMAYAYLIATAVPETGPDYGLLYYDYEGTQYQGLVFNYYSPTNDEGYLYFVPDAEALFSYTFCT